MQKFILTLLLIMVVTSPLQAETGEMSTLSDLPRHARLALFTAQENIESGDLEAAARTLKSYFQRKDAGNFHLMHYHYGNVLSRLGRTQEAAAEYAAAVRIEPRHAPSWLGLGEAEHTLSHFDSAGTAIMRAYRLSEEKRPELLYFAGASFIMGDRADVALPVLEELVTEYEAKMPWYRALISACVETADTVRGNNAVDRMLERFPDDADAWHLAFQYAAGVGNYRMAAVSLTVTGYLRPLERRELLQLGDLYAAIETPTLASAYYARAVADSTSPREYERLASSYLAAYESDRALETLQRAIADEPTYRLWSLLGDLHFMEKRFADALDAYRRASELDPDDGRPHLMMGYCAYELGDMNAAVEHLRHAAAFEEYAPRAQALIRGALKSARADEEDDEDAEG